MVLCWLVVVVDGPVVDSPVMVYGPVLVGGRCSCGGWSHGRNIARVLPVGKPLYVNGWIYSRRDLAACILYSPI